MIARHIFRWSEIDSDKIAVIYNGHGWSYGAFADIIDKARGFFARRSIIGPGFVIVAVNNILDFWILSLALRSLGLTTVAAMSADDVVELDLPDLRFVVTTFSERWPDLEVICARRSLPLFFVRLDGEAAHPRGEGPDQAGGHVLHTSGTTGTYKKVLIDPSFETEFLRLRIAALGLDRHSLFASFDFPVWTGAGYKSPVASWIMGAGVVLQQWGDQHASLLQPGLTHAVMTPLMLSSILKAQDGTWTRSETMQLSVTGGSAPPSLIAEAKARITPHVISRLAATETSIFAMTPLQTPDDFRWHRLLPNKLVEVVGETDRPLPAGSVGELRVSTADGPSSYLNDPETTARFFRNGFFYTGDLAMIREDGRLGLQGRVTDVINVRGAKISPVLIEDRLRETFGLGVCILSLSDPDGEEVIHLVVESEAPIEVERLTEDVRSSLPDRIEIRVHQVASIPRNEMGKISRLSVRRLIGP